VELEPDKAGLEGNQTYIGINLDRALRLGNRPLPLENQLCIWKKVTDACNAVEERRFSTAQSSTPMRASAPVVAFRVHTDVVRNRPTQEEFSS
jgi:hypothetical protein